MTVLVGGRVVGGSVCVGVRGDFHNFDFRFLVWLVKAGAGIEPAPGGLLGETGANHFRRPWPHRAGVTLKFDEPLQACFVFSPHGSDPALTLAS